jgi:UDP-N-acetylmuramoylalanine--D-glutamate ligase
VVLAVTGTNGKTTVTALTGQLVQRAGKSVAVAGNIGPSLLDTLPERIDAQALPEVWVLELSSFQLDGAHGFEPTAATVLNITQDHLDWHGDMAAYAAAKARSSAQRRDGAQPRRPAGGGHAAGARSQGGKRARRPAVCDLWRRHAAAPGDFGIEVVGGMAWLVRALEADETQRRRKDDAERAASAAPDAGRRAAHPRPPQRHQRAGRAGAGRAAAARWPDALRPARIPRRAAPRRVGRRGGGVEYFDDSKGTNVGATVAALHGLGADRRVVVILGGDGKGQDFAPLAAPVARYARAVVLIGRDGRHRPGAAGTGVPLRRPPRWRTPCPGARARPAGDAVLLSPACASLDMFRNYAHRAEVFRAAVHGLAHDAGASWR